MDTYELQFQSSLNTPDLLAWIGRYLIGNILETDLAFDPISDSDLRIEEEQEEE